MCNVAFIKCVCETQCKYTDYFGNNKVFSIKIHLVNVFLCFFN